MAVIYEGRSDGARRYEPKMFGRKTWSEDPRRKSNIVSFCAGLSRARSPLVRDSSGPVVSPLARDELGLKPGGGAFAGGAFDGGAFDGVGLEEEEEEGGTGGGVLEGGGLIGIEEELDEDPEGAAREGGGGVGDLLPLPFPIPFSPSSPLARDLVGV
jgi:hypothetical protein